jgi:hypothetical protein
MSERSVASWLAILVAASICSIPSRSNATALTGVLRDQHGIPVPNQVVWLYNPSRGRLWAETDASGAFALDAAPDRYVLTVAANNPDSLVIPDIPQYYGADVSDFDLTVNRVQDLTLPTITINVRVEDGRGRAVQGARVFTCQNYSSFEIFPGGATVDGASCDVEVTDVSGLARGVTVFPNARTGEITVTPPADRDLPALVFSIAGASGGETFTTVLAP